MEGKKGLERFITPAVAGLVTGFLSWYASTSQSKNVTEAAYDGLKEDVKKIQEAVLVLDEDRKFVRELIVSAITGKKPEPPAPAAAPAPVPSPEPASAPPRGEGIGAGSLGTIGHGAGAGSGSGFGSGSGGVSLAGRRPPRGRSAPVPEPPSEEAAQAIQQLELPPAPIELTRGVKSFNEVLK